MSKEALVVLNRKRGDVKAQLTRIKDFMNNPDEKDKTHLESKLDTLKSLRIKLSDIRNEYYEVVAADSDLEPLESEILDLEDDCEDIYIYIYIYIYPALLIKWLYAKVRGIVLIVRSVTIHFCVEISRENVGSQRSPGRETLPNMESPLLQM
ncbi:hypothetical protein TNCV_4093961 [Trichonephila clavipes]|nr:hypothetical protein TNCV_4093961 [Trichonephila clavipes]